MVRQPHRSPGTFASGRNVTILFAVLAALWFLVLMGQPVSGGATRLTLFLVPGETILSWTDGPVSWRGLVDRLFIAAAAVLTLGGAYFGGRLITGGCRWIAPLTLWERAALAIALGLAIQSTIVLALGMIGALRQWWALPGLVACLWLVCAAIGMVLRTLEARTAPVALAERPADSSDPPADTSLVVLWTPRVLALLFALVMLARAVLPPAEYDVREYHLQAPKEWWQEGEIGFMPHNIYANMPMAAESQVVVTMIWWEWFGAGEDAWWWGALSGKAVIAAYAILAAIMVGGFVRLVATGRGSAITAATAGGWTRVLVLGFPALMEGAAVGLIEAALASYLAAGMLIAAAYRSVVMCDPDLVSRRRRALGLATIMGLVAGAAIACKYPAVVLVLPALFVLSAWAIAGGATIPQCAERAAPMDRRRPVVEQCASVFLRPWPWLLFLLAMGVAGGLWYAKNAVLAGNPVYPMLGQWLGGRTLTPEKIDQWNRAHQTPDYTAEAVGRSTAALLWGWRLQDWSVVPLVAVALCAWNRWSELRMLFIAAAIVGSLWWLVTHRVERFLVPALPLVLAVAGIGVVELFRASGARMATWMLGLLAIVNGFYVSGPVLGDARMFVDPRYLRVDDLSASSVSRLPSYVVWMNRNLSPTDRVLIVGDAAAFDFEIPIAYSTTFDRSPLMEALEGPSRNWGQRLAARNWGQRLAEAGFTHILVHWTEIARLRSTYGFDPAITPALIDAMKRAGAVRTIHSSVGGEGIGGEGVGGEGVGGEGIGGEGIELLEVLGSPEPSYRL